MNITDTSVFCHVPLASLLLSTQDSSTVCSQEYASPEARAGQKWELLSECHRLHVLMGNRRQLLQCPWEIFSGTEHTAHSGGLLISTLCMGLHFFPVHLLLFLWFVRPLQLLYTQPKTMHTACCIRYSCASLSPKTWLFNERDFTTSHFMPCFALCLGYKCPENICWMDKWISQL